MSTDQMVRFNQLIEFARTLGLNRLADTWLSSDESNNRKQVRVVILGEFNHGKSSLINAMVGEPVLPFGVTPTTQLDTWISFGAAQKRVLAYSGGDIVHEWDWKSWSALTNRCMPDVLREKSVDRLKIELDSDAFDKDCIFIDTPGLNEASLVRESYLKRYLTRADLLVFVLDANQALTHTEQAILKELAVALKPERRILVINKCDRLDDEEWLEICNYVEQTLVSLLGNEMFYMVSARKKKVGDWQLFIDRIRDAIKARKIGHENEALMRQNEEMESVLEGFMLVYHALEQLGKYEKLPTNSQLDSIELARILNDISSELNRLEKQTSCDLEYFKNEFLHAMPRELDKARLEDIEQYFEDFIDETFKEFAETVENRLGESLNDIVRTAWKQILNLDETPMGFNFQFTNVSSMKRNPVSTGAFDLANSLGLWLLPLPSLIASRAERPRRRSIKTMAEKAIALRTEQYIAAFSNDLEHINDILTAMFRENGLQMGVLVNDIGKNVNKGVDIDDSILH